MADYITKEKVKEEILSWARCINNPERLVTEDTLYVIDALPAADVRPVVRGKWVWRHRHRGGFRRVTGEDDFGVRHTITVDQRYQIDDPYCPFCGELNESVFLNYCPNCGADMREETIVEAEGE